MSQSRREAKAETRNALIAAGMAAFAEEGLDASLDGICARAGYTRGAFYVHFEDRDDFLVAVMERVGASFLEGVFAGRSLPSTVSRFVEAVLSGAYPLTTKSGVKPHQLLQACARSPRVRMRYVELIESSLKQLRDLITLGQERELRDDVEPEHVAALLMAIVIGAQTMLELEATIQPRAVAATVMRLLGRGRLRRPT
jgi:AcrR family transcriptional regulator